MSEHPKIRLSERPPKTECSDNRRSTARSSDRLTAKPKSRSIQGKQSQS
ncbi:hypothetical protein T12_6335 [Trichinella patagoniensis]|uniref:Uncharacterized protein n=1 Tax=Trichinella patagoniensis TaxID=990121 RepID=A0A0V0ZCD4_9BILA|nr:hypothetical protein T12_6335 [Trichinella patagoniensis]